MAFKMRFRCDWPMKQQSKCSIVAMQRPNNSLFLMILGNTVRKAKPAHHQVIHRWNKNSNPRLKTPMFSGLVSPWSSHPKKEPIRRCPMSLFDECRGMVSNVASGITWLVDLCDLHGSWPQESSRVKTEMFGCVHVHV